MADEKVKRELTNEDLNKYNAAVEHYLRKFVVKNWNESMGVGGKYNEDVMLGNTGMSIEDIRQQLKAEVCVALQNFNPNYRTPEGLTVKESTFVFQHLFHRVGQMMKRLTKPKMGYGVFHSQVEQYTGDINNDKD